MWGHWFDSLSLVKVGYMTEQSSQMRKQISIKSQSPDLNLGDFGY